MCGAAGSESNNARQRASEVTPPRQRKCPSRGRIKRRDGGGGGDRGVKITITIPPRRCSVAGPAAVILAAAARLAAAAAIAAADLSAANLACAAALIANITVTAAVASTACLGCVAGRGGGSGGAPCGGISCALEPFRRTTAVRLKRRPIGSLPPATPL